MFRFDRQPMTPWRQRQRDDLRLRIQSHGTSAAQLGAKALPFGQQHPLAKHDGSAPPGQDVKTKTVASGQW